MSLGRDRPDSARNWRASGEIQRNDWFTTEARTPFPPCSGCGIFMSWCGGGPYRGSRPCTPQRRHAAGGMV